MSFNDDVSSLGDPDVKDILGEGYQDYLKDSIHLIETTEDQVILV